MTNFFAQLSRRNVSRVGAAYSIVGWIFRKVLLPIWLFAVLILASAANAELPNDIEERIQAIVDEEVANSVTPGAGVSVVAEGRIVASVASGLADRERGRAVTRQTVFPAASISKLLTATLVMRQVERGQLDLDRAANDYLEAERWIRDASGGPVGATVRQLLTHSSGLPTAVSRSVELKPDGNARSLPEYLEGGLRTKYSPGQKLQYTNEGFALLGYLSAQADGETFEAHAQQLLLAPLGMHDSSFTVQEKVRSRLAIGYAGTSDDNIARAESRDFSAVAPGAWLHSTADDLSRFALMHLGEGSAFGVRVLKPASVHEMMRLQARQHPSQLDGFGLGFGVLGGDPQRRMVFWDGSIPGAASRLALLPEQGVGVVILTNLSNPLLVDRISRRIFDLLVGPVELTQVRSNEAAQEAQEVIGEYRISDMLEPSMWYVNPFLLLTVDLRDGHLEVGTPFFGTRFPLHPRGAGHYRLGGAMDGATVFFEDDRLYALFLEGRRVSVWETSTAIFIYAGITVLLVFIVIGRGLLILVRRVRRGRAT